MRNLKKVLSLALALVMLLGMMVVGAGAATDYTDADQISNLQAVEVADALGIIKGEGGQFMPTVELDRAQAAQIIARMLLGPEVAATLTSTNSQFVDTQGHWAAAPIAYCASNGIIEGDGGVHFYPNNKVTGFQFAKMLLVALGYDAKVEGYNGSGWRTNVAIDALQAGLTQGVQVSDAVLTRDAAVQMVLNCLTADMVYYTLKTDTFGQLDKLGNDKTNYRTTTLDNAGNTGLGGSGNVTGGTSTPTNRGDTTMQFCELYFPNLKLVEGDVNGFGDIIAEWKIVKGNTTETISETDVAYAQQYTAYVTKAKIYSDLGMTAAHTCPYFVDGVQTTINISDSKDKVGGNGAITTVWINENGDPLRITVKNIYVGDVVAVNSTNETVTVAPRGTAADGYISGTASATGFAVGDVVLYNNRNGAVVNVSKPETLSGSLENYNGRVRVGDGGTFLVNGNTTVSATTKEYSDKIATEANEASLKRAVRVILDTYGYVIDVEGYTAPENFAFVIGSREDPYNTGWYLAKMVLPTGEVQEVCTGQTQATANSLVSYTLNKDTGIYTVTNTATVDPETTTMSDGTTLTTKGVYGVLIDDTIDFVTHTTGSNARSAHDKTVFIVKMGLNNYQVYLGIANVPTIKAVGDDVPAVAIVRNTTGIAEAVYIDASANVQFSGSTSDHVFVLGNGGNNIYGGKDAAGKEYYYYTAIVNGVLTPNFRATNKDIADPTLFSYVTYGADGVATLNNVVAAGTGTEKAQNGAVGLNGLAYIHNDRTLVYKVNTAGTAAQAWSVASIPTNEHYATWVVGSAPVELIIFQEKTSGDNNQQTAGGKLFLQGAGLSSAKVYTDKDTSTELPATNDAVNGKFVTIPQGATKVYVTYGSVNQHYRYTGKESTPNLTVSVGGTVEIAITNLNTTTGGYTLADSQFVQVYAINYDVGRGTGATTPTYGATTATVAAAPTAPSGHVFVGWLSDESPAALYAASDTVTFSTTDVNMKAVYMSQELTTANSLTATSTLASAGFTLTFTESLPAGAIAANGGVSAEAKLNGTTADSITGKQNTAANAAGTTCALTFADSTAFASIASGYSIEFTVTITYGDADTASVGTATWTQE